MLLPMKIPKPTATASALFDSLVPDDGRAVVKPMFGNFGAFINGNMFMGVFGADVGLKLVDADQQALREAGGQPFGPSERSMSGYVALPPEFTQAMAKPWVDRSINYVGGLPAKTRDKPAKKR